MMAVSINLGGLQICFENSCSRRLVSVALLSLMLGLIPETFVFAVPEGYQEHTVPLDASAAGLAFGQDGILYALEAAQFGSNQTQIRVIQADNTISDTFSVEGNDPNSFFVGGFTYDSFGQQLLITDNTVEGRIYSVSETGVQKPFATGIPTIADIAVRSTGEIFVSTALGNNLGEVLLVNRADGTTNSVVSGIDFGAGLAFDLDGNLIVQEADASTFAGRLHRLAINEGPAGLEFGDLSLVTENLQSSYGLILDGEGDIFTTGRGGLFTLAGDPLAETLFVANVNPEQFSTAIAFDPGDSPFEPFSGADTGRLAYTATSADQFVTMISPTSLLDANFNDDDAVDQEDLSIWNTNYGQSVNATNALGDTDGDFDVDGMDFIAWQREFDFVASAKPAISSRVPEPTALLSFAVALLTDVLWRNRRMLTDL